MSLRFRDLLACASRQPSDERLRQLARSVLQASSEQQRSHYFLEFARELALPLTRIILQHTRRHEDPAHLGGMLSDVLLRLYQALQQIYQADRPSAMAARIIYNACKNYIRDVKDKENKGQDISQMTPMRADQQIAIDVERLLQLLRQTLDERSFFIVTAYYGIGRPEMDPQEIARELGLSYTHVMHLRREAVARMREVIQDVAETII